MKKQNKWRIEERIARSKKFQNPENSYLSEIDDFPPGEGEEIKKSSLRKPQSLSSSTLQSSSSPHRFTTELRCEEGVSSRILAAKEKRKVYLVLWPTDEE
jgi:hypothetical protein